MGLMNIPVQKAQKTETKLQLEQNERKLLVCSVYTLYCSPFIWNSNWAQWLYLSHCGSARIIIIFIRIGWNEWRNVSAACAPQLKRIFIEWFLDWCGRWIDIHAHTKLTWAIEKCIGWLVLWLWVCFVYYGNRYVCGLYEGPYIYFCWANGLLVPCRLTAQNLLPFIEMPLPIVTCAVDAAAAFFSLNVKLNQWNT